MKTDSCCSTWQLNNQTIPAEKKSYSSLLSASSSGYFIFSSLTQSHQLWQSHKTPPMKLSFSNYVINQKSWNDETTLIQWDVRIFYLRSVRIRKWPHSLQKSRRSFSSANVLRLPRGTPSRLSWNHKIALDRNWLSHEENHSPNILPFKGHTTVVSES